jgi:DNA-binding response OmpR family regulator
MHASEVLLIEDNAGDALLVGRILSTYPMPVHLHVVRDGEQAMQVLGEANYKLDLIILDLNIPKLSGFSVLALYHPKLTPVVVFSASLNQADADRALSLGADEFVHKPMDIDEYRNAVSGMVQKWASHGNGDMESIPAPS